MLKKKFKKVLLFIVLSTFKTMKTQQLFKQKLITLVRIK